MTWLIDLSYSSTVNYVMSFDCKCLATCKRKNQEGFEEPLSSRLVSQRSNCWATTAAISYLQSNLCKDLRSICASTRESDRHDNFSWPQHQPISSWDLKCQIITRITLANFDGTAAFSMPTETLQLVRAATCRTTWPTPEPRSMKRSFSESGWLLSRIWQMSSKLVSP